MSGALNGFTNTGDKHVSVIDEGSSEFEGSITPSRKDSWYGNWKDRRGSDAKSQAGANAVKPVRTFKWWVLVPDKRSGVKGMEWKTEAILSCPAM